MRKKTLRLVKNSVSAFYLIISIAIGILFYSIFLGFQPGTSVSDLIMARTGLKAFALFGICACILIIFPVIISALFIYDHFSGSYITASGNGSVHLSDKAIEGFIQGTAADIEGVESPEAVVDIFKEMVGIHLRIDTFVKSDLTGFSERLKKKIIKELELNLGINKFKYFHVIIESIDIHAGSGNYKVSYK
jgi:hypothetical protein